MAQTPTPKKENKRDETFFEKIGTLGRKKTVKEVEDLEIEGQTAIESPSSPTMPDLPPSEYILEEGEERSMVEPKSRQDSKLQELIQVLIDWLNDELSGQRIIVKDIEDDLYDGQILGKLVEKLAGINLEVVEVTQSEQGQKQKLRTVLAAISHILNLSEWDSERKWTVDGIHSKNLVSILHLLVALAQHFLAPIKLPDHVTVRVVVVQKKEGLLHTRHVNEEITGRTDALAGKFERDAFDTLFDHAPDKLHLVKKSLIQFVNKHLNKISIDIVDLESQFHDGVYLVMLMGLLDGYFVPLYAYHLTPTTTEQKVQNVTFAFELMMDAGLPRPKARPEDIVNLDLKSTLRVLYNLLTKYKTQG